MEPQVVGGTLVFARQARDITVVLLRLQAGWRPYRRVSGRVELDVRLSLQVFDLVCDQLPARLETTYWWDSVGVVLERMRSGGDF